MKKKIAFDMLLNIVASAIPVFVLQLLILPNLAGFMSDEHYGLLVTILALLNVVPSTFGNSLNNVRLIEGNEEGDTSRTGDYNALLLLLAGLNLIIVAGFSFFYERQITAVSLLLTLLTSLLWLCREYFIVAFRIKLNYVYIMISNVIMVLGYALGYGLFRFTGHWQFIYIFGHSASILFVFSRSNLWKEPISLGPRFRHITGQTAFLALSNLLGRITTYADKLLIFPILGGATVSVYYAATLFGKVVSMVITPVSGVILSYLSKAKKKNDSAFRLAFLISAAVCIIGYFACVAISRPVLGFLYPQFVEDAMQYIWVTTGTMVLNALISIVNPFILKFFDLKWQIAVNGAYVVVYVGLSMSLLGIFGLFGFCLGTLAAVTIKLMFLLTIYRKVQGKTID